MRRRGKWLLPPRPAISRGILLKARNAQKATVDPTATCFQGESWMSVCACVCVSCMHAEEGGGGGRKEGDVGQFSRARSTYRQAARNNLAAIDATLLKIEPPSREGCNTT